MGGVGGLRLVEWMIVAMAVSTTLLVAVTVGLKAVRALRQALYGSYYRRIEPALESFVITGEPQPELERLRPWERDRFLSTLMVERMALLRGAGRDYLFQLAANLGLVDRYLGNLRSLRKWRRARAAENLGYFGGERAVEPLGALLSDRDETVRAVAARALARIGTKEATERLARTLDDPSELTRLRAAENLERLGDPAIGPLSGIILELPTEGAVVAARVLGHLRARRARPALSAALLHTCDDDVRAQTTLALGRIGDPADVPLILQSARNPSWPVRAQAANALGFIGEVSALPVLKELAADHEWWVRLNACKALANMGPSGEAALLEILDTGDRFARNRAAATLEARGVTRRMVRNLARGGKKGARAQAVVGAVIRSGSTRYLGALLETLPEDGGERRILAGLLEEHAPKEETPPATFKTPGPDEPATDWVRADER